MSVCYMFQLKLTFACTLLSLQVYLEGPLVIGKCPDTSGATCSFLSRFGRFFPQQVCTTAFAVPVGKIPQFQCPEHHQLQWYEWNGLG